MVVVGNDGSTSNGGKGSSNSSSQRIMHLPHLTVDDKARLINSFPPQTAWWAWRE